MKSLAEKRWARILAAVLFAVFLLLSAFAAAAVRYGRTDGWYYLSGSDGFEKTDSCMVYVENAVYYIIENVQWTGDLQDESLGSYAGSAFSYTIGTGGEYTADTRTKDSLLVVIAPGVIPAAENAGEEENGEPAEEDAPAEVIPETEASGPEAVPEQDSELFTVEGYINLPVQPYGGCYAEYILFETLFSFRYWLLIAQYLFLLLAAVSLLILCLGAAARGRAAGLQQILRLPYDLMLLIGIVLLFLCSILAGSAVTGVIGAVLPHAGNYPPGLYNAAVHGLKYAVTAVILSFLLWYLCGQLGAECFRERLLSPRALSRVPAWVIILAAGVCHAVLIWAAGSSSEESFFLLLWGVDLLAVILLLLNERQKRRVRQAARELSAGNLDYKADLKHLHFGWHALGVDLNRIGDGMSLAVEERMKSERMKTELITNVSHDLKTPLTSLINYIGFLRQPGLDEQTRAEYLEVLEKQSAKLKKLTEDVVEASKAASGAVTVNLESIDAVELLEQLLGEYADRMEAAGIEPVLNKSCESAPIYADSSLLGRVLENLITNITKYAQRDTRAYFDLTETPETVSITAKNISREPLNIPAEELLERFVRGDSSRHSEGSGLGLSIANSLTEIMGGTLRLILDGDLFKAELTFPRAAADAGEDTPPTDNLAPPAAT